MKKSFLVQRIMVVVSAACLSSLANAQTSRPANLIAHAQPDAHRVRTGQFEYQDMDHGRKVGGAIITVRQLPNSPNYDFSAHSPQAVRGFDSQRWDCITTPALEPLSVVLSFGRGGDNPPVFDLRYHSRHVTGFVVNRKEPHKGEERPVDAILPEDTFDQRVDWATVLASSLTAGREFEFNVYDPSIGVSHLTVRVMSPERIQVLAGSFDVYPVSYQIQKKTGAEQYEIWSARDSPRFLVREKFPNGLLSELVAIKPM